MALTIQAIKVGAHTIPVVAVNDATLIDDDAQADYDTRRLAIRVEVWERPPSAIVEKLLHECIHAWCDDAGRPFPEKIEERVATVLAPRLAAFLADNPEQVRELLRMLSKNAQ